MSKKRTNRPEADAVPEAGQAGLDQAPGFLDGLRLDDSQKADFLNSLGTSTAPKASPRDLDQYRHFLDDTDMTEEQKTEYLETVWNIVCNFVDFGFGVHPVQQALAARKAKPAERPHAKRKPKRR